MVKRAAITQIKAKTFAILNCENQEKPEVIAEGIQWSDGGCTVHRLDDPDYHAWIYTGIDSVIASEVHYPKTELVWCIAVGEDPDPFYQVAEFAEND